MVMNQCSFRHSSLILLRIQHLAFERGTVIESKVRQPARLGQSREYRLHTRFSYRGVDFDRQAFPGTVIDNRQAPQPPTIGLRDFAPRGGRSDL